jgi:DNA invertase Pin-like site-specific DNA recombinase
MIKDALDGKIDLIVLKSVQRFARNTLDTVGLARQLKEAGVEVIFEENNITNFDPNGELNLTINASIAQEESRQLSNNVKWGKDKMYRQGITSVAYSQFLGYDKHPDDPKIGFIVNEEEAKLVRRIYKEFLRGKSPSAYLEC